MSPRNYRLGRREDTIAATRARIIVATGELLTAAGGRPLSLEAVARQANVSRGTVYHQFGTKRGLLEAVIADVQRRAGQEDVDLATERADPVRALRDTIIRGCQFWAREHQIVRGVTGLAAADPDVRGVLDAADEHRQTLIARLADRLAQEGKLRTDCSVERAVDVLSLLCSFEAFDHLLTQRRIPDGDVGPILADLATRTLCTPTGPASRKPLPKGKPSSAP